uniref:Uncharacterized protein n=1 Tax=Ditylenchus dipsaci TaxID=166011 RepID=A0A915ESH9_9BILA
MKRFRLRLSPRNFLYIRQLHTLSVALCRELKKMAGSASIGEGVVFTLSGFIAQLACSEIDFFKVLEYLDQSKLCRKLRDFHLRYSRFAKGTTAATPKSVSRQQIPCGSEVSTPQTPPSSSRFGSLLQRLKNSASINKENSSPKSSRKKFDITANKVSEAKQEDLNRPSKSQSSSTPLYQLKEFLEALTSKAEDARIVVQKATSDMSAKYFTPLYLTSTEVGLLL